MVTWGSDRSKELARAVIFRAISVMLVLLLVATVGFMLFRTDDATTPWVFPYAGRHQEDPFLRDEPLLIQYFSYLVHTFSGDFYTSSFHGDTEVSSFIYTYATRSMVVVCLATVISVTLGLAWGWLYTRTPVIVGKALHACALILLSVPALLLMYLSFRTDEALNLGLLPPAGTILGTDVVETLKAAVFPSLTLAVCGSGFFALVTIAGIRRAEKNGIVAGPVRALCHVSPMQYFLVPLMVTLLTLIEPSFLYRGLVWLLMDAVRFGDGPVLMAAFFILSVLVIIVQLMLRIAFAVTGLARPGKSSVTGGTDSAARLQLAGGELQRPKVTLSMVAVTAKGIFREYLRSRAGASALIIFIIIVLVGVSAGAITGTTDPWLEWSAEVLEPPSADHLLGTDAIGRDVFDLNVHATKYDVSLVAAVGTLSMLVGFSVGLLAYATIRLEGIGLKACKGIFSIISDIALAVPVGVLVVLFALCSGIETFLDASVFFVVFMWCWMWWFVARSVREACSRKCAPVQGPAELSVGGSLSRFRGSTFLILARTTFVTKILVPLAIIVSMTAVAWPVPTSFWNSSGWEALLYSGYSMGGFITSWWLVYPPIIELMLLTFVCYVGLNSLEHVFERRSLSSVSGEVPRQSSAVTVADAKVEGSSPGL